MSPQAIPRFRAALETWVAAGIELLDAMDEPAIDREDDEREVVCEDDGAVDAMTVRAA